MVAVVEMSEAVRLAHDPEPLRGGRLLRRDDLADAVDEDLGAAAGDRVEPGVAQARQRLGDRELGAAGGVLHLGGRERVQVDLVARLDRREEILVVVHPEIGMVAALHEQAGAAERERLLDLLEDHRLRQQVALAPVTGTAVEGAEVAVRVADVRVVQVAVDDEGDAARVGPARPALVGDPADRDELARAQQRQRVLIGDPLAGARLLEDLTDRPVAVRPVHAHTSGVCRGRIYPAPTPASGVGDGDGAVTNRNSGTCVELAGLPRQLEERQQPRALARAEAVAELLEVAGEEACRVAVALARLAGELLRLGPAGAVRLEQRLLDRQDAVGRGVGAREHGVDHG